MFIFRTRFILAHVYFDFELAWRKVKGVEPVLGLAHFCTMHVYLEFELGKIQKGEARMTCRTL